ncbi:hypothetical protein [Lysinibacillus sp. JNUCC 51]|uniref:hypothetical protein n=1 Tax=Lysinibacillus sp. JNUCC-51 TaxID=2792479 RepID=UPI0019370C32|nr:hypothetical protein JNUCC51_02800 [Lysinibacillus sp. JNUCC-51]
MGPRFPSPLISSATSAFLSVDIVVLSVALRLRSVDGPSLSVAANFIRRFGISFRRYCSSFRRSEAFIRRSEAFIRRSALAFRRR